MNYLKGAEEIVRQHRDLEEWLDKIGAPKGWEKEPDSFTLLGRVRHISLGEFAEVAKETKEFDEKHHTDLGELL